MITLCEKDGATIIVIEDATAMEQELIANAKSLLQKNTQFGGMFANFHKEKQRSSIRPEISLGDTTTFEEILDNAERRF